MSKKNNSKIQYSTNLKIGGKTYNSLDISRIKPHEKEVNTIKGTENMPRSINKEIINQSGVINTLKGASPAPSSFSNKSIPKENKTSTDYSNQYSYSKSEESQEKKSTTNYINERPVKPSKSLVGVANFTSVNIRDYDNRKIRISGQDILTASATERTAKERVIKSSMNATYNPNIIQRTSIETKVAFYSELSKYKNKPVSNFNSVVSRSGRDILSKTQSFLSKNDDTGTQAAGSMINAGVGLYSGIRTAQSISPAIVGTIKNTPNRLIRTGKGMWDITLTTGRASVTIVNTGNYIKTGIIPMNAQAFSMLKTQSQLTGLNSTILSRKIIHRVESIKNRTSKIKTGVTTTTNLMKKGINTSYTVVRGISTGKMTANVSYEALLRFRKATIRGVKTGAVKGAEALSKGTIRSAVKGGMWTWNKGIPKSSKLIGGVAFHLGNNLAKSDDMAVQGVGGAVNVARYGVKTSIVGSKASYKGVKTGVNLSIKTGKKAWHAGKFIKNKGLKSAYNHTKRKMSQGLIKAGKSIITAAFNFTKLIGMKFVIPLALIVAITLAFSNAATAPMSLMASLFGGTFSTTNDGVNYEDHDIREYLEDPNYGVPYLREKYIQSLVEELNGHLVDHGGHYHFVRFYTSENSDDDVGIDYASINSVFYTTEQISNIIQPIFNAVLVMDYALAPSDQEARDLLEEIFDSIFSTTSEASIEYCGQDADGTIYRCDSCGEIHANDDCPTKIIGVHTSFTCDSCCYYYCDGHTSTDSEGNESTSYCSGCKHACNGYEYCGGHDVLSVTLNMDGVYGLLAKYFTDPIDQLSNLTSRTYEQDVKLQDLLDYYELCLVYISEVNIIYGGGLSMEDISGVVWVNGTRTGNQALIDLALSQVGQTGGQPYWSWYGFASRVEWCATFVSWSLDQSGYNVPKFASTQYGGVPWFKSQGQWTTGGYTDLVAGDVIFFDWNGDGRAQHVGLVIGTDGTNVYTVEGNSGDAVKVKTYSLNSSVILGYGLLNH